jgi:hypothetical protein
MAIINEYNFISPGFAVATIILKGEKADDFYKLHRNFLNEHQPATHMELTLVEKMVHNQWLSLRAIRLQSERLQAILPGEEIPKDLGLLIRYQTAADRAFHKCHAELLKLQKERAQSENGFVRETAAQAPEPPAKAPEQPPAPPQPAPVPACETTPDTLTDDQMAMIEQEIEAYHAKLKQAA